MLMIRLCLSCFFSRCQKFVDLLNGAWTCWVGLHEGVEYKRLALIAMISTK